MFALPKGQGTKQLRQAKRASSGVGLMNRALLILMLSIASARAAEADLPAGYSCADVRAAVQQHGRAKALKLAKRNGAAREQLAAAEKCL